MHKNKKEKEIYDIILLVCNIVQINKNNTKCCNIH